MNNIEILEELINGAKEFNQYNGNKYYKAIENLIQENKELKEALRSEIQTFNKMKELAETIRKENVEYIIQNRQYELHYIPKSKVKEKIEELQEEFEYLGSDNKRVNKMSIEILQELLKEGGKQ